MSESGQIAVDQRPLTCARCGAAFACGADTGACWCGEEEFRLPMPAAGEDCICPACLRKAAGAMQARRP